MDTVFPTEILRTFLAVIDTGSMLKASERARLTPSAVSLQIKRLEEISGCKVFYRDRRNLTLTSEGEVLEGYARQILALNREVIGLIRGERATGLIKLGVVEDFARTLLAGALRHFAAINPEAQIQLRVSGSRELNELVSAGRLDLALGLAPPTDKNVVTSRPTYWFGIEELTHRPVLPLALLDEPCQFRAQAIQTLEKNGISYEIAVETASVSALQAAVEAGLGVTLRTASFISNAGPGMTLANLPQLMPMGYTLTAGSNPSRSIHALRTVLMKALNEL